MNTINVENCKTLLIGRRGENEVTTVSLDFTEWASEFGSGVVDLYVKRFGDNSAYPVVLTIDGTVASWLVTETDTNVAGYGKAEYVYRVDGKIAKSAVFPFFVAEDIGQPASEPPDPYESWLEQLTALGAETEAHAQAAEQSAENAADSAEDAAQSATSADGYAGQAETAAGLAQAAQTASEAARDAAQTAQASAEASATAASGSAASAAGSASDASASATAAGASATTASTAATQAEAAKTAAQTAQSAAEDAAEDAQQAAQQAHVEYEQLSGEVDDLSDEVAQQKSAIEDLEALTNRKAGMLVDTASGTIASFVPDSTIPDLLGVSVDIEPVQDLHGYDAPWPGGGGKNLMLVSDDTLQKPSYYDDTWAGTTVAQGENAITVTRGTGTGGFGGVVIDRTFEAGQYTFSCKASVTTQNKAFYWGYYADGTYSGQTTLGTKSGSTTNISYTVTIPENTTSVFFKMTGHNNDVPLTFSELQFEKGSTATSYAPYSNICPISGWNSVELETAGVNLWDKSNVQIGYVDNANGEVVPITAFRNSGRIKVTPNTQYYILTEQTNGMWAAWYDKYGSFISGFVGYNTYPLVTSPANAGFVALTVSSTSSGNVDTFAINYPSTDHDYHPYTGNRYTIQLGQTVHGAKLTISEDGSVNALVDRAMVDLGTLTWAKNESSLIGLPCFTATLPGVKPGAPYFNCSEYAIKRDRDRINATGQIAPGNGTNATYCVARDDRYASADAATYKTAVSGVQLVYELATPIEIQLSPVIIAAIANQTNNVWANAGDVTVKFAADLKSYIDRLNQPAEDDMIANSLIAANKYFTVNNRLFLSTASIAAGAMIIPGTNCQETSLAAALNALNA